MARAALPRSEPVRLSAKADAANVSHRGLDRCAYHRSVESVVDSIARSSGTASDRLSSSSSNVSIRSQAGFCGFPKQISGRAYLPPFLSLFCQERYDAENRIYQSDIFNSHRHGIRSEGDIKDIKRPLSAPWLFIIIALSSRIFLWRRRAGYFVYRKKKKQKADAIEHG